jgi:hypothetical protein
MNAANVTLVISHPKTLTKEKKKEKGNQNHA